MPRNFIWIIDGGGRLGLKPNGISTSYIIAAQNSHGYEKHLADGHIWLISREKHDILTALLKVKRIERFIEGYYKDDFLIHINTLSSFRVSSNSQDSSAPEIELLKDFDIGIHEISFDLDESLSQQLIKNIQVKLTRPPIQNFSRFFSGKLRKSDLRLAKMAIETVTQNFNLDHIWASGIGEKLGPYGNFAEAFIKSYTGSISKECITNLKLLDPINLLKKPIEKITEAPSLELFKSQQVDIDFTPIDISTIYARQFVASVGGLDMQAALAKTELAEQLHQDMLRDICSFLDLQKIIPFETNSIDLMFEKDGLKFFEIKSTTNDNIFAQCAKGAFQLAYYNEVLKDEYESISFALIIHKIENLAMEASCISALKGLNITCLLYDPSNSWPSRLENFFNI